MRLEERLRDVFSRHGDTLQECRAPPIELHYLWAQLFDRQVSRLSNYLSLFPEQDSEELVLIVGAPGYWVQEESTVPSSYFDMLEAAAGQVSHVFVMGAPTEHVPVAEHQRNLQLRNEQLRQWVANQSSAAVEFFDYNRIARASNAPRNLQFNDWHFACHWDYIGCTARNSLAPTQDCRCQDDMNLAIWQGLLNSICNRA